MPKRYIIVLAAAVLAGLLGWGAGLILQRSTPSSQPLPVAVPAIKHFSLVDQNGQPVNQTSYQGKWVLLFFGFIRCPDVCPTSMIYASDLLKELGPVADKLQVVFVTVDPERDTPLALKDYLANFDPRITGLTGTPQQVAAAAETFGVHFAKRALDGQDDYTMDHSTAFYLVDPQGGFRRAYNLQRGADEMTAAIRAAITPKD
jgi:protein SCO1/2